MTDIIDRIDQLVDEQMADGEPWNGFDAGDPDFPRCPHCDRHWHGLPITERIADMYGIGLYDENYRVDTDTTTVLCQGSDFSRHDTLMDDDTQGWNALATTGTRPATTPPGHHRRTAPRSR